MGAEKRKFERFPARLEVEIRTRGRGQICPSADVSRHGMYLTTPNPPHERQLLILRIPVPDDQPPIDVMASVVRRHSPGVGGGNERPAGMGINFFALTEENKNRWEAYLAKLRGEAPRPTEEGVENNRPTFLLQPRDVGRLQLFESRDFSQGSMFLRTPVLREADEIIKVMLLHPVTDEEFPLLARVKAVHNGSKTEPKGMTLDFVPIDAEVRSAFHAFVEHGVGSSAALKAAGAVSTGKEIPPLFAATKADVELSIGNDATEEVDEMMLVTEEEISSDRMIDLLSDLEIEVPVPARSPATKPPLKASAPSAAPVAAPQPAAPPPEPAAPTPSPETLQLWEELRTSLEAAPEDVSLLFRLGSGLARDKSTAFEAVGFLQRLLALEPHHPLANGALALAYAQIGQRAAAERHLSRARRMGQLVDARVHSLLAAP
jgi:hypothetical protein